MVLNFIQSFITGLGFVTFLTGLGYVTGLIVGVLLVLLIGFVLEMVKGGKDGRKNRR